MATKSIKKYLRVYANRRKGKAKAVTMRSGDAIKGRKRKLTPRDVQEIREFYSDQSTRRSILALARSYEVSTTTIINVVQRLGTYADLGEAS